MKSIIYFAKTCGLANRLRALVGYQALSDYYNVPFYLCWRADNPCNVKFQDVFDMPNIKLIDQKQMMKMKTQDDAYVVTDSPWFWKCPDGHIKNINELNDFKNQVLKHTNELNVQPDIMGHVEEFAAKFCLNNAIGMHIRFTDNTYFTNRVVFKHENFSQIKGFERYIRDSLIDEDSSAKIFLATDNKDIEKKLYKKFSDNLIVYPKKYFSAKYLLTGKFSRNKRASSVEDALKEMILLGKCRRIIGTYYSSFSKFAAFWAKVSYQEVRGGHYTESINIRNEYLDRITDAHSCPPPVHPTGGK